MERKIRRRWRFFGTSTWFLGYQVTRTYLAPWSQEVQIFLIPGIAICWSFDWCGLVGLDEPRRFWWGLI